MPISTLSEVSDFEPGLLRYVSNVMPSGLVYLNADCNGRLADRNDFSFGPLYDCGMAEPKHDWYIAQWLKHADRKQSDVVNDLGWNKAKISLMARGKQPYDRDAINELAAYLHVEPFELLLPPERAMAIRQYRASAEQVVKLTSDADANDARKTGTHD